MMLCFTEDMEGILESTRSFVISKTERFEIQPRMQVTDKDRRESTSVQRLPTKGDVIQNKMMTL